MDNTEETGANRAPNDKSAADATKSLGNEILNMLYERTSNPSDAFVMLQQICVFLWDQYKIDWQDQPDFKASESRKQRYLDFVSSLIDNFLAKTRDE